MKAQDEFEGRPQAAAADDHCGVFELRQYLLHPGARERLIALFEGELVEPQEEAGMRLVGQFRDRDRPDVFTWVRGFADMRSRTTALRRFYDGPVWAAHRDAANSTMINSDNVRLLRPAWPGSGFPAGTGDRVPAGPAERPDELVVVTIYTLLHDAAASFSSMFRSEVAPLLAEAGAPLLGALETEPSPNGFPRLPVREGERCFVVFASFPDAAAYEQHLRCLATLGRWGRAADALEHKLAAPTERWRLAPTVRSLFQGAQ
jgi:quinol monooxygenase YgiN